MSANPNGQRVPREVRVRQVRDLRDEGLLLREIAATLGLHVHTVHDYLSDPAGEKARARRHKRNGTCRDCGRKTYSGGSRVVPERCRECTKAHALTLGPRRAVSERQAGRVRWSDGQILDAIRATARDGIASSTSYDDAYGAAPKGSMPSRSLILLRFGLWSNAVLAAGLSLNSNARIGVRSDRMPTEGLLLALEECEHDVGHPPSYYEYVEWARESGAPSGMTIRNRFGTWMAAIDALLAALLDVAVPSEPREAA